MFFLLLFLRISLSNISMYFCLFPLFFLLLDHYFPPYIISSLPLFSSRYISFLLDSLYMLCYSVYINIFCFLTCFFHVYSGVFLSCISGILFYFPFLHYITNTSFRHSWKRRNSKKVCLNIIFPRNIILKSC